METLRCRIGDLAVVVGCHLPENTGNIVKIIGVEGYQGWYGITGHTFVWTVEVTKDRPLVYENADGGLYTLMEGPVPDQLLIPISSDLDSNDLAEYIVLEAIKECERLEELERCKELESTSLMSSDPHESYSPIDNCIKKYPGLTEEKVIAWAEAFGF
ncbi:hypothetical protein [Polynucleobacter kasalickyi]|uniref:Uncharacterized protein n=1 Tax=Polynucleobacter kasalickyi TaxID=1938817 RepID=A0A1W2AP14_9BURK|nr:hypothetical protein [Polynucleobacter kasalickyi]SMC62262.1 hypothetical protein SAMN06296008_109105 [Polynucleobacter kasalickyi]